MSDDKEMAKLIAESIIKFQEACFSDSEYLAQAYLDLLKSQEGMVMVPLEPDEKRLDILTKGAADIHKAAMCYGDIDAKLVEVYKSLIANNEGNSDG